MSTEFTMDGKTFAHRTNTGRTWDGKSTTNMFIDMTMKEWDKTIGTEMVVSEQGEEKMLGDWWTDVALKCTTIQFITNEEDRRFT